MKFRTIILYTIALCTVFCIGCTPDQYEPEDGVWYCEDLQIQLSYDVGKECYAIIDGEKITAACGSDRGVKRLYVSSQQKDHPKYYLGKTIFAAEIISLNETEFVVYDEQAQREYIFYRIE